MLRSSDKHVVAWLVAASLGFACAVGLADDGAAKSTRSAVPKASDQEESRKLLAELFRDDMQQAKKPEEKSALIEKMLQTARETQGDPASQYVLFQITKEFAIAAFQTEGALQAVDGLGNHFDIDVPEAKLATVTAIEKSLKVSKDRQALLGLLDPLVDELIQADRYDLAKKACGLSQTLARKVPDANAVKQSGARLRDIDLQEKLFGEVQKARKVLETQPDDPVSNLSVGRYYCLVNGNWETGLPLLVKGNDALFRALAQEELAKPQEADKQAALADAWWALSEKETGLLHGALQQRAVVWYQTALPKLSGVPKVKATDRIDKVMGKSGGGSQLTAKRGTPSAKTVSKGPVITNGIGMKLVLIPAGTFMMGSPPDEPKRQDKETQHRVKLTKAYYLGMTEVTQQQWTAIMETKPWQGKKDVEDGANIPALYVSWNDVVAFCSKLSAQEKKTYRLPTEAEWEYACRAGTTTPHYFDPTQVSWKDAAWCSSNMESGKPGARQVGQKLPNPAGLFDMYGNVWELCADWQGDYPAGEAIDPQGPTSGKARVIRGGSFASGSDAFRSAYRHPATGPNALGFRVVCEP